MTDDVTRFLPIGVHPCEIGTMACKAQGTVRKTARKAKRKVRRATRKANR